MSAIEARLAARNLRKVKDITNDQSMIEKENQVPVPVRKIVPVKRPTTAPPASASAASTSVRSLKTPAVVPSNLKTEKSLATREQVQGEDEEITQLLEYKVSNAGNTFKQKEELTKAVERFKKVLRVLKDMRDDLVAQNFALERSSAKNEGTHKEQLDELNGKIVSLQESLNTEQLKLEEQVASTEKMLEDFQTEIDLRISLEKKIADSSATIDALEIKLRNTEASLSTVSSGLANAGNEVARLRSEVEEKDRTYRRDVEALSSRLNQETESHSAERVRLETVRADFNALTTRFAVLEQQYSTCQSEVERLRLEKDEAKEARNGLAAEREDMMSRLREAAQRQDAKEIQLNNALSTMKSNQERDAKMLEVLAAEKEAVQAELIKARAELDEARAEAVELRSNFSDKSVEAQLLVGRVAQEKENLEKVQKELTEAKQAFMAMNEARNETFSQLQMLEAEFRVHKERSTNTQSEEFQKVCELERAKAGLSCQMSTTEEQLRHSRMEAEHLRHENQLLMQKIHAGDTARRKLHNELQELKGNIRVFARVRPGSEVEGHCPLDIGEEGCSITPVMPGLADAQTFHFDKVFSQRAGQEEVFAEVSNFVQSALDGYNVVLLAYGQTGAGKTHTMIGGRDPELRGVIPRSIEQILRTVEHQGGSGWQYELEGSFLEIYNETIRDLLVENGQQDAPREIKGGEHGGVHVTNLVHKPVKCTADVAQMMRIAEKNRTYAKTDMNAQSSRSHSVFQLRIKGTLQPKVAGAKVQILRGALNLVDLAGSERLDKSGAVGDRKVETQNINKSLSTLATVFSGLAAKEAHVKYRDSKLTYLLSPCLSGDGKALFIVNFSPAASSLQESICTLRFSSLISTCELGKAKKHISALSTAETTGDAAAAATAKRAMPLAAAGTSSSSSLSTSTLPAKRPQTAGAAAPKGDEKRFRS